MATRTLDPDAKTRVAAAINLRRRGVHWDSIAQQCGYSGKASAYNAVKRELQRNIATEIEMWRLEQLERLQALWVAIWPNGVTGFDPGAIAFDRLMAIMDHEAKILGGYAQADASSGGNQPVRRTYVGVEVDAV